MLKELNKLELELVSGGDAVSDKFFSTPLISNIAGLIYGAAGGFGAGALAGGVGGGYATGGLFGVAGGTLGYVFTAVWGAFNGGIMGLIKGYDFTRLNIGNDAFFKNWMDLLTWNGNNGNPLVKG